MWLVWVASGIYPGDWDWENILRFLLTKAMKSISVVFIVSLQSILCGILICTLPNVFTRAWKALEQMTAPSFDSLLHAQRLATELVVYVKYLLCNVSMAHR